jgi:outer membrane receptor for ferrienterochelin and colicins
MIPLLCLVGGVSVLPGYLGAQEPISDSTLTDGLFLRELVIAGASPNSWKKDGVAPVDVVSRRMLTAMGATDFLSAVQYINGLRPQINCNVCQTADIRLNGMEGAYTMVLIDGLPIVSGLGTVYGLNGIPTAMIERVEISRGPSSVAFGSEAMAGALHIITRDVQEAPAFAADVSTTSWWATNADLGARFRLGKNTIGLSGLNAFYYGDPQDRNGDGFTDMAIQKRLAWFNKLQFSRKDNRTSALAFRILGEDRWGGQMGWTPAYRGGDVVYGESIRTGRWELMGAHALPTRENLLLSISANGHYQDAAYGTTRYIGRQHIGFGQLAWSKNVPGRVASLAGIAWRYTAYNDNTPATADPDGREQPSHTHLPGLFVQQERQVRTGSALLYGLRLDYTPAHGCIWTPRLGYTWQNAEKTDQLRVHAGTGFRVANVFTEDHAAISGSRTVVMAPDLRPERSVGANIRYSKQVIGLPGGILTWDASAFYTVFSNRILPDYDTDPNLILYDNLDGQSVARGIMLNATWSATNGLQVQTGLTLQEVYITEQGERTDQLFTENISGVWRVSYTIPSVGLGINYSGALYGPMRLPLLGPLDDRPEYAPWWSMQDLALSYPLKGGVTVYGGIRNLLHYRPPANSIARPFDPFDRQVVFDQNGEAVATPDNPNALTFDPTYAWAPNQGRHLFAGLRWTL